MVAHLRAACLVMRRMRRIAGGDDAGDAGVIKRDERKVLRDGC